jgi:tryptophanyl-tRNA synthetase
MRILSGIQRTGVLHIGNYFGTMRPATVCKSATMRQFISRLGEKLASRNESNLN